ncbi:MAG TPA: BMP family ABC transporter substrate-binding protein [Anaerolineales bacterium]|nr:BMP family ABC transporter substrate-binding protein [Anaerolineales bacterium]
MKKSTLWILAAVFLISALVLGACTPAATETAAPEATTAPESTTPPEPTEPPAPDFTYSLITPNPRGDRSFIDASVRGVEQANEEFGLNGQIIETASIAEQEAAIRTAISAGNDLILALAPDAETLLAIATENPDQKFGVPSDIFVETLPDNVAAFQVNVHEGSYLAGIVAGMMTETGTVGAVVGGDAPGLNQFYWAYKQGVLSVCPDCEVLVGYLAFDFSNPTLGKETALAQYEQGADIIFQVAGRSGEGVLSAAAETGNFAIGVDSNQDWIQPGSVITSMLKKVDVSTYLLVKNALEGNFQGGFAQVNMADGATGLSWDEGSTDFEDNGPENMVSKLADVKAAVEEARQQILDGTLEVCDALNDPEAEACAGLAEAAPTE